MNKQHRPLITADEARRLYEVLSAINTIPVKDSDDNGSSVHKVYGCVAQLILLKAGISLGRDEQLMDLLEDVRKKVLSYNGCSYINGCDSGCWESLGVEEREVRGALLLGSYLSRSDVTDSFLDDLKQARAYFEETEGIEEDFYFDFLDEELCEDYEDEEDMAYDLGSYLAVEFIDAVCMCLNDGAEHVLDTCVAPIYDVVCVLDENYEDNLELFVNHLPGLLIKLAEPYVSFGYDGNGGDDSICGCLGQQYYLIEGAAKILPYLEGNSDDPDVKILHDALVHMMGCLYTHSYYTERLRYYTAKGEDICISSLVPQGESAIGDEPIPDFRETFAPLLWEALYPVVAEKYLRGDIVYEQAA